MLFRSRLFLCNAVSCGTLQLSSRKPITPARKFLYLSTLEYKANQQRWKPSAETWACLMSASLAKLNRSGYETHYNVKKGTRMLRILTGSKHRLTRFVGFGLSGLFTTRTSVMILDGN